MTHYQGIARLSEIGGIEASLVKIMYGDENGVCFLKQENILDKIMINN